ncbi:MAG: helix-turn-helix transcriptional regulator [Methylococcales bacterium]
MRIDKDSVALAKVVGHQMHNARVLCGYTLEEASKMIGISRDLLRKYETHLDIFFIPALVIFKCSQLYDVTNDYLFNCAGDDWERDPVVLQERAMGVQQHKWHVQELAKIATELAIQQRQIDTLNDAVKGLVEAVKEMDDSLSNFQKINDFQDLRAGSQLVYRMKKANATAIDAIRKMIRSELLPQTALNKAMT